MSDTTTTLTEHGEVSYETVTCASCDATVPKDQATRFVIGDVKSRYDYTTHHEYTFHTHDCTRGWACDYCRDSGIVDTPSSAWVQDVGDVVSLVILTFVVAWLFGVLVGSGAAT